MFIHQIAPYFVYYTGQNIPWSILTIKRIYRRINKKKIVYSDELESRMDKIMMLAKYRTYPIYDILWVTVAINSGGGV
ncbi:hypothetical protein B8A39_04630 [Dolosigranulum pigrum]|nr:hypothetical protein B8A39_04630 [Dolosigranulum pigrum]RAN63817.1 hypothetical protein B8A45_08705 [Dolosigranulum pigrum]